MDHPGDSASMEKNLIQIVVSLSLKQGVFSVPKIEGLAVPKTVTLVTLIVVQDILIVFQHFSSQDILIKDRTFINFRTFSPQDVI